MEVEPSVLAGAAAVMTALGAVVTKVMTAKSVTKRTDNDLFISNFQVIVSSLQARIEALERENKMAYTQRDACEERVAKLTEHLVRLERTVEQVASKSFGAAGPNIANAIIITNSDGVITSWNDKATLLFGHFAHEVIGRKVEDILIPPDQREHHAHGFDKVKNGELPPNTSRVRLVDALCRDNSIRKVFVKLHAHSTGGRWIIEAEMWPA